MKFSDLNLLEVGNTIQMSGGIWSDSSRSYLCFFPKDKNDLPIEVLEMDLEEWAAFVRQTDILETEILKPGPDGALVKALYRKSLRQIDTETSWAVYRRDGYRCRYCGNNQIPLTVDHVLRWEEGGPSTEENLISACKKCNKTRGAVSYRVWLNSSEYREVSKNLPNLDKIENERVLAVLPTIKPMYNIRSR